MRSESSNRRLKIAYLSVDDPNDRRSWSGIHYSMAEALQQHCGDVFSVGPLHPLSLTVGKVIHHSLRLFGGQTYLYTHTSALSRKLGKMTETWLSRHDCDVLFAPAGSVSIAHLNTKIPIVYFSDTTFRLIRDYYPEWRRISRSHIRMAEEIERLAIQNARQLVFASSWAARSAIKDFNADPSKVHVVPFGANIDDPPSGLQAHLAPDGDGCRLLFVGVNWERKGGDIALEAFLELEKLGVRTELTVVGCRPPEDVRHPNLRVIPFLDKNDPIQREQLRCLYQSSDFMLLPTRAECQGIVLCEASAFGVPVLSTQTGGVPEVVREGVNGYLFSLEARGDQYARRIRDIFQDRRRYEALRASSREEFDSRLNWDSWAKNVRQILWSAVELDGKVDACAVGSS